jgi:hypothetical protein
MPRSSSPSSPDHPLDPNREEIKAMARLFEHKPLTLADYHGIGEQLHRLAEDDTVARWGSHWRKNVAEILEQSPSTLTKCLQFFRTYKQSELVQLERLKVGWVGMSIALSIPGRKERHRLLRQARDEGWGQQELRREARQLKGTTRGGGRPRRQEKSRGCLADASELVRRTEHWSDFYTQAWGGNEEAYAEELPGLSDESRESLERILDDAEEKLRTLKRQCDAALRTVKALRKKMPAREEG